MQLVAWWQAHPLAVNALDQRDPRAPDFNRRQAAALAGWQALRSEDRDAGELQETLEDMREALSPQRP
ncbi:MAG: hypothetical protein JWP52_2539, partial [Rhizobacter sp.]|nr:hypothetical protein [Rhizobacter sp.]